MTRVVFAFGFMVMAAGAACSSSSAGNGGTGGGGASNVPHTPVCELPYPSDGLYGATTPSNGTQINLVFAGGRLTKVGQESCTLVDSSNGGNCVHVYQCGGCAQYRLQNSASFGFNVTGCPDSNGFSRIYYIESWDPCGDCLQQCHGLPGCCTGSGCFCEKECR